MNIAQKNKIQQKDKTMFAIVIFMIILFIYNIHAQIKVEIMQNQISQIQDKLGIKDERVN